MLATRSFVANAAPRRRRRPDCFGLPAEGAAAALPLVATTVDPVVVAAEPVLAGGTLTLAPPSAERDPVPRRMLPSNPMRVAAVEDGTDLLPSRTAHPHLYARRWIPVHDAAARGAPSRDRVRIHGV